MPGFGNLDVTLKAMESHQQVFSGEGHTEKVLTACGVEAAQQRTHSGGREMNDKGSFCRDGMLGMDSRAIKDVALAGHGN